MHRVRVAVAEGVLDANETIARANREDFNRAGVTVVNLMSAPGAGKTALLERAIETGLGGPRIGVLEGDVQGSLDADRIAHLHVPVVQLNTDPGFGGECRADCRRDMVIPRRDVGHEWAEQIERGVVAHLALFFDVHLHQMQRDVAGAFDHDLAAVFPGFERQLAERFQLGKLRLVVGVGQ